MAENVIEVKTFDFAINIVKIYKKLCQEEREFVLSKQLLRAGTSIGANVSEAQRGQTKADFNAKMNIALKEANETLYWIKLLYKTEYISADVYEKTKKEIKEIIAILTAICKKTNF